MNEPQRAPDGRTREEILAKILSQPETQEIASSLGMDVADYAERVLHYVMHPDAEPQVELLSDEDARAAGMPSAEECVDWLQRIESGEIDVTPEEQRTRFAGFDDDERSSVTLTGGAPQKRAPKDGEVRGDVSVDETSSSGAALRQQVLAARDMARATELRPREPPPGKGRPTRGAPQQGARDGERPGAGGGNKRGR